MYIIHHALHTDNRVNIVRTMDEILCYGIVASMHVLQMPLSRMRVLQCCTRKSRSSEMVVRIIAKKCRRGSRCGPAPELVLGVIEASFVVIPCYCLIKITLRIYIL
jgi:hypothetical protein